MLFDNFISAYYVEFKFLDSELCEFGSVKKEYWTKELLCKRLKDFHYTIELAKSSYINILKNEVKTV